MLGNFQRAQIQQLFNLVSLFLLFVVAYCCCNNEQGKLRWNEMYIAWNICSLLVYLCQLHGVVYLLLFAGLERAQAQWRFFPERCGYSGYGDPKILTFEGINVRLENVGDLCMDPHSGTPVPISFPYFKGFWTGSGRCLLLLMWFCYEQKNIRILELFYIRIINRVPCVKVFWYGQRFVWIP